MHVQTHIRFASAFFTVDALEIFHEPHLNQLLCSTLHWSPKHAYSALATSSALQTIFVPQVVVPTILLAIFILSDPYLKYLRYVGALRMAPSILFVPIKEELLLNPQTLYEHCSTCPRNFPPLSTKLAVETVPIEQRNEHNTQTRNILCRISLLSVSSIYSSIYCASFLHLYV